MASLSIADVTNNILPKSSISQNSNMSDTHIKQTSAGLPSSLGALGFNPFTYLLNASWFMTLIFKSTLSFSHIKSLYSSIECFGFNFHEVEELYVSHQL